MMVRSRRDDRLRVTACTVGVFGALCGVLGLLLALVGDVVSVLSIQGVSGAIACVLAMLILDHVPRNRAGWALLLGATLLVALSLVYLWAVEVSRSGAADGSTVATLQAASILAGYSAPLFLLLFPTGTLPSRRWRPVLGVYLLVWLGGAAVIWAWTARSTDPAIRDQASGLAGGLPASLVDPSPLNLSTDLTGLVFLIAGIAAIVTRLRGADHVARAKVLWALWGLAGTVLVMALASGSVGIPKVALTLVAPLPMFAGITIAMRRHQLFDVERLVRRSVTYAAAMVLLVGLYAGIVVTSGAVAGQRFGSSVGVAAATLAVAAAFRPLLRGIRGQVDRRFDQRTWKAVQEIDGFTARLRHGQASPSGIEAAIRQALEDPTARVAFVDGNELLAPGGESLVWEPPASDRSRVEVEAGGEPVAIVDLASRAQDRPRLVAEAMSAAALPLENAALHARATVALREVQASRRRIVLAEDEQRRRIERDLHDGAQQRLMGLALSLRIAERELATTDPEAAGLLADAVDELRDTVEELRDLTRGLLPAVLTEEGLAVALRHAAARFVLPVRLDVPALRLPPAVESTCWFVACEGLANAAKHANATQIQLALQPKDNWVTLEISDDGVGGARALSGGGLEGMADRLETIGGTLNVASPPQGGTRLRAELPCGS